jgi:hypothetical protein
MTLITALNEDRESPMVIVISGICIVSTCGHVNLNRSLLIAVFLAEVKTNFSSCFRLIKKSVIFNTTTSPPYQWGLLDVVLTTADFDPSTNILGTVSEGPLTPRNRQPLPALLFEFQMEFLLLYLTSTTLVDRSAHVNIDGTFDCHSRSFAFPENDFLANTWERSLIVPTRSNSVPRIQTYFFHCQQVLR